MKRLRLGVYLLFVFGAIGSFICATAVTIDIIQDFSIKNTIALGFFLMAACAFSGFAFECKKMEFSKKPINPIKA